MTNPRLGLGSAGLRNAPMVAFNVYLLHEVVNAVQPEPRIELAECFSAVNDARWPESMRVKKLAINSDVSLACNHQWKSLRPPERRDTAPPMNLGRAHQLLSHTPGTICIISQLYTHTHRVYYA